eukprot:1281940-Pyramimonas_sp.AAC.1
MRSTILSTHLGMPIVVVVVITALTNQGSAAYDGPIRCRKRGYILTMDQSDAGIMGIFSRWTLRVGSLRTAPRPARRPPAFRSDQTAVRAVVAFVAVAEASHARAFTEAAPGAVD